VALSAFRHAAGAQPSPALGPLFSRLESQWYPPSADLADHFAEHARAYEALLERVRTDPDLENFDEILFPGVAAVIGPAPTNGKRDRFYTYQAMLELMQSVFIDLDLEESGDHPHNAGWVQLFHRWASELGMRDAWRLSRATYSERFRRFCEDEWNMPRDDVARVNERAS